MRPRTIIGLLSSLVGLYFGLSMSMAGANEGSTDLRPTDMSTDEAGLWYQVDKIEEHVKTSGLRITDPELVEYVQRVTCKVIGPDCVQVRPYILNVPSFNASMYPNGMMLVQSGLLLRAENEAQLACVIGHEYGHFNKLHSIQRWRKAKSLANLSIVLSLAAGSQGAGQQGAIGAGLLSAALQQSFSRDHEREADAVGFEAAAKAGYRTQECADVWTNLISEIEGSQFKKVRKTASKQSIFSSHPLPTERVETLGDAALENPGGDLTGEQAHKLATDAYLEAWLRTELLAKDYDRHIHLFEELKARGRNAGVTDYYTGEAYRLRRKDGDRDLAVASWERASKVNGAPAEVWRALGEHYRKKKRKEEALDSYQKYLSHAADAPDRELIQAYVNRLNMQLGG